MVGRIMGRWSITKIKGVNVQNCSIVMVWLKTSEQGWSIVMVVTEWLKMLEQVRSIVTVTKNVGAGSEQDQSNVTVTKKVEARLEQNMIHDTINWNRNMSWAWTYRSIRGSRARERVHDKFKKKVFGGQGITLFIAGDRTDIWAGTVADKFNYYFRNL